MQTSPDSEPAGPLLLLAVAAATVTLAVAAWSFEFVWDDFGYLIRASLCPWQRDSLLRVIGVQIPFWLAAQSGAPRAALVVMNLAAVVFCAASFAVLLRAAGWTRAQALLAALLFCASDPVVRLVVWGSGLQQLLAWALVFVIAHAARSVVVTTDASRARAWTLVALGFAGFAALTKWQFAWVAVPSAWIWADDRGLSPHARRRYWMLPLGIGAMMAVPLLADGIGPGVARAGAGHLFANVWDASRWTTELAAAALAAIALGIRMQTGSFAGLSTRVRDSLSKRSPPVRRALAMGAVAVVPFLFATEFAEYYVGPVTAWLAAALSPLMLSVAPRGRRKWVMAACVVLLWLPFGAFLDVVSPVAEGHQVAAWLSEVHEAVAAVPAPGAVEIHAECATDAATRASRARLEYLFELADHGQGVQWVTGWLTTPVICGSLFEQSVRPLGVVYCDDARPRMRITEPSP